MNAPLSALFIYGLISAVFPSDIHNNARSSLLFNHYFESVHYSQSSLYERSAVRVLCDDTVRTVVMIQLTAVYYIVYIIVVIYRTNPNSRALAVISVNYN